MRFPPTAAGEKSFPEKAAGFSLWLLAATPLVMLISYRATSILLPLAAVPALYMLVRSGYPMLPETKWGRFFLAAGVAFFGWSVLSAAWSPAPIDALIASAKVAAIILSAWVCGSFLVATRGVSSETWLRFQFGAFTAASISIVALVLVNHFFLSDRFETDEYKQIYLISPTGEVILRSWYNQAVAFICLWAWVVAVTLASDRLWARAFVLAVAAIAALSVGYWIGVVAFTVGLVVYVIALRFRKSIAIVLAVGVIVSTFAMPLISAHFPSFEDAVANDQAGNPSIVHRTLIWRFVSDAIAEKPLFGWGMNGSRHVPGGDEKILLNAGGMKKRFERLPLHPHDSILQVWLELGAVGAVLYGAMGAAAFMLLGRLKTSPSTGALLLGCLTAAFVMMGGSFSIWSNWWLASMGIVTVITFFIVRPIDGMVVE